MKPILAVWLAVLALLCLWICLEPGSECTDKTVIKTQPLPQEAAPVALAGHPEASLQMPLAVVATPIR